FAGAGVSGFVKSRSKPPDKKPLSEEIRLAVVEKTMKERPANATHWSVRTMAAAMGISHTSVQYIWREHGLTPNNTASPIRNDFFGSLLVLAVDEKCQIQALDRT